MKEKKNGVFSREKTELLMNSTMYKSHFSVLWSFIFRVNMINSPLWHWAVHKLMFRDLKAHIIGQMIAKCIHQKLFKNFLPSFTGFFKRILHREILVYRKRLCCCAGALEVSRASPLACWFSSMLYCFGGAVLSGIMLAEPPVAPLSNGTGVLLASIVW